MADMRRETAFKMAIEALIMQRQRHAFDANISFAISGYTAGERAAAKVKRINLAIEILKEEAGFE